ncbi:MAG: hypothetical protein MUC28_02760 [Planctomycetes bacterium]|jgi:hypothetical protein|nr:hypothetical protein [Planctomycetota bacterium]
MKTPDQGSKQAKLPEEGRKISFKEFLDMQKKEMLGETNMYYASKAAGHQVSSDEAALHYIKNGGAADFRKRYGHLLEEAH